ncbi:MAG TPA: JAB domain-containing protein [Candidatus Eisenbacteria bacterium]|nr:JAB domain-containing protein [Candidatus Eisenbacteria bacterium]
MAAWSLAAVAQGSRSRSMQASRGRGEADDVTLLQTVVGARGAGRDQLAAVLREGRLLHPDGNPEQSARHHGWSRGQLKRLRAFCELARRCLIPPDSAAPAVTSPKEALLQFQDLRPGSRESFAVLYLNARNQPLGREVVAVGGLNIAQLRPREVFAPALTLGAAAVVLAHNHPSGDPTPSPEDLAVTRHLLEAGELLGVEVLDHLVLSADRFRSIREAGGL